MKKFLALALVCSVISGCSYLGSPESYTVVDENVAPETPAAPAPAPAPVVAPAPVTASPCGGVYCAAQAPKCGCAHAPCQMNPGVAGPIMINIPSQSVMVQ